MLSKSTLVAFAVGCRWDIHTNHHKKYNGNPEKMWRFISKTGGIFTNAASIHPQKCARHPLVFDEPCLILGDDEWMASRHFFFIADLLHGNLKSTMPFSVLCFYLLAISGLSFSQTQTPAVPMNGRLDRTNTTAESTVKIQKTSEIVAFTAHYQVRKYININNIYSVYIYNIEIQ